MDAEFGREVLGRLEAMERTQAWLARRLGLKTPSTLHNYIHGKRPWPVAVRIRTAAFLDIRDRIAA